MKKVALKVGDKVSAGSLIAEIEVEGAKESAPAAKSAAAEAPAKKTESSAKTRAEKPAAESAKTAVEKEEPQEEDEEEGDVHAGPGVRRLAREFGIDLAKIQGSGAKGRILKEDLQQYVKQRLPLAEGTGAGFALPPAPSIDFSKFGPLKPNRYRKFRKFPVQHCIAIG